MFDIGWTELLIIAIIAIVVVGPRELPGMLRTFGRYASQLRRMAGDFQSQFNDALREAELDEVKKSLESVQKINPVNQIKDSINPLKQAIEDSVPTSLTDAETAPKQEPAKAESAKAEPAPAKKPAARKSAAKKTAAKAPARRKPAASKTPAKPAGEKTA